MKRFEDEIRRFEKRDCWTWGGFENFSNNENDQPLIFEFEFEDAFLTIIGDKTGIGVMISEEESLYHWAYEREMTSLQAKGEMRALIKAMRLEESNASDIAYILDNELNKYEFLGVNDL